MFNKINFYCFVILLKVNSLLIYRYINETKRSTHNLNGILGQKYQITL